MESNYAQNTVLGDFTNFSCAAGFSISGDRNTYQYATWDMERQIVTNVALKCDVKSRVHAFGRLHDYVFGFYGNVPVCETASCQVNLPWDYVNLNPWNKAGGAPNTLDIYNTGAQ